MEPHRDRLPLTLAAGFVVGGALFAQALGALAAQLVRTLLAGGGAPATMLDGPFVMVPAMMASAGALIAVALLAPSLSAVPLPSALGLQRAPLSTYLAAAVGTVMLGPTADHVMALMHQHLPGLSLGVVPMLNEMVEQMPVWVAWPALALLPGVSEELVFRGLLQRAAPPGARAILLSGCAFALFHIDPHHVAGVLPLGLFLAWVGSRVGTQVTIFAHVVNNTVAIAALHSDALAGGSGTDEPVPLLWLPPSLLCVAACAYLIARSSPQDRGGGAPELV